MSVDATEPSALVWTRRMIVVDFEHMTTWSVIIF